MRIRKKSGLWKRQKAGVLQLPNSLNYLSLSKTSIKWKWWTSAFKKQKKQQKIKNKRSKNYILETDFEAANEGVKDCSDSYHEHLGDVAGTKDFVNGGEPVGFERGKIGRERALFRTSSPQQLTCRAWRYFVQQVGPPSPHNNIASINTHLLMYWCIPFSLYLLPCLIKPLPTPKHHKSRKQKINK